MKLTTFTQAISIALALSAPIAFADTNSQAIGTNQNQTSNTQQTQPGTTPTTTTQTVTTQPGATPTTTTETVTTKPGITPPATTTQTETTQPGATTNPILPAATDVNQKTQQVKPVSADQPQQHFVGQEKVLSFAEQAAIATFSYDYKNYQTDMKKMETFFTESGWESFDKAIKESKNLDVIQKEKLNVTAKLNGQAKVVKRDQFSTGDQWVVEIPIQVTYQNENNQQFNQELIINMTLVHNSKVASGLGIRQFIAKPAQKQEQAPA